MKDLVWWNNISHSVLILIIIPFILYFATNDIEYIKYLGACMIITEILHEILKFFIFGDKYSICKRPSKACNCSLFVTGGESGGKPGCPSGHMTITACFYTSLYIMLDGNVIVLIIGIVHTYLMALARLGKNCHNNFQILLGIFLGMSIPIFFYLLKIKI